MLNITYAQYALVPCAEEISIFGNSLVGPKTQIVPVHTSDYETFRNADLAEAQPKSGGVKKAIFVDQNTPHHIDYLQLNGRAVDAEAYYTQLRKTFDTIENNAGVKIEISKHPRAVYDDADPCFGGRPIYGGRTVEMIAESDLVLTHHSTAIGFAILLRKPIAFLVSKELYNRHPVDRACYDALSKEVGSPLRFMDKLNEKMLDGLFNVDLALYDSYASRYLRHPDAKDAPYWDSAKAFIPEIASPRPALNNVQSLNEKRVALDDR